MEGEGEGLAKYDVGREGSRTMTFQEIAENLANTKKRRTHHKSEKK